MFDLKIRIRLYHYHDLDLVSLYREGRLSIPKAVKYSLNAFAEKRYVRLETNNKKCEKVARPVYTFNIILNEKKDKKAIELLDKIDKGFRNNFMKQLLRVYLGFAMPDCYTSAENLAYFLEREKEIFKERKTVPAPAVRNAKKKTVPEGSSPQASESAAPPAAVKGGGLVIKELPPDEETVEKDMPDQTLSDSKDKEFVQSEESNEKMIEKTPVKKDTAEDNSLDRIITEDAGDEAGNESAENDVELIGIFKKMMK